MWVWTYPEHDIHNRLLSMDTLTSKKSFGFARIERAQRLASIHALLVVIKQ